MIIDGHVLRKGEAAYLQKESEVVIGGEPILISNYEYMPSLMNNSGKYEYEPREESSVNIQGMNLKECLFAFYKYRKVTEQRKDPIPQSAVYLQ